jgi:hypothetical protein
VLAQCSGFKTLGWKNVGRWNDLEPKVFADQCYRPMPLGVQLYQPFSVQEDRLGSESQSRVPLGRTWATGILQQGRATSCARAHSLRNRHKAAGGQTASFTRDPYAGNCARDQHGVEDAISTKQDACLY